MYWYQKLLIIFIVFFFMDLIFRPIIEKTLGLPKEISWTKEGENILKQLKEQNLFFFIVVAFVGTISNLSMFGFIIAILLHILFKI